MPPHGGGKQYIRWSRYFRAGFAMNEPMISIGAAAALLGVDKRTVRRMVRDKRLRAYRTPAGHHRFRRQDVEALAGRANPEPAATSRGPTSSALQAEREEVERLKLKADRLHAEDRLRELEAARAQKEAERQAAAEEERRHEAEERAQAKRQEAEQARQEELRQWRAQMIECFAGVSKDAPPALRNEYYRRVTEALARFDCEQPSDVAEAAINAVWDEVFGPWEEDKKAWERDRAAQQVRAQRDAWLREQKDWAWRELVYYSPFVHYGGRADKEAWAALDREVEGMCAGLSPGCFSDQVRDARARAIELLVAPLQAEAKKRRDVAERAEKERREAEEAACKRSKEELVSVGVTHAMHYLGEFEIIEGEDETPAQIRRKVKAAVRQKLVQDLTGIESPEEAEKIAEEVVDAEVPMEGE